MEALLSLNTLRLIYLHARNGNLAEAWDVFQEGKEYITLEEMEQAVHQGSREFLERRVAA